MLDSTICDVYLVNESNQLVGRPVLTLAVDAYSSLICGYHLSWEGGVYSLQQLMHNVVTEKVAWCQSFGISITPEEWPVNSLPGVLVTDKGKEYVGNTFEQLTETGVRMVNLPPYRPELKGKMVYHHYTSYDAMDSKMYIYDFEENSLKCISEGWKNVKHPMNGHFSPNGDFVTFMGIGDGGTWDVFVYYFGEKQPVNLTLEGDYRDEDPKVSYDGNRIVFKRNDRISEINLEDRSLKVLSSISGSGHHSMPYYTIDGKKAVCGCGSEGEDYIGLWDFATSTMKVLYDRKGVVEYYPITLDAESFYYSAHVSQTNRHDQLYKGFFDGSPSQKLKFNNTNADYSDACPVSAGWLILCSTRSDSKGGYDLYIAHETSGAIYPLSDYNSSINTSLNELGADYYGK